MYFRSLFLCLVLIVFKGCTSSSSKGPESNSPSSDKNRNLPAIVLHGGAGAISKESLGDSLAKQYENALSAAIQVGYKILDENGSALDAVEHVINQLENNPLFNAGKGAVLNANGLPELDASIMDGKNLEAGAVAGIGNVSNPISLARMVKDSTSHVLLSGLGAQNFAFDMNVDTVGLQYFLTPKRLRQRQELLKKLNKKGTVGCVALDKEGNIAAGTSTGGMHGKKYGRIGDSPIIGAGTYANNKTCGVSCTGHGEYFIKNAVAYDMHARLLYNGSYLQAAADSIVNSKLLKQDAKGGLIALNQKGEVAISFNTQGMFWAFKNHENGEKVGMFSANNRVVEE